MNQLRRIALVSTLIASFTPISNAHSWPEEVSVISANGDYIGEPGYPRGYVDRNDPEFIASSDSVIKWMLPSLEARMPDDTVRNRIDSTDLLCTPYGRTNNYTNPTYPKLKVKPGDWVAIKYLENGHVTLPWNAVGKPELGGTVYIYGTTRPDAEEKIVDVLKWNKEGTGGDSRGSLLAVQNYDDGRCHQINNCVNSAKRQVLFPLLPPDQPDAAQQEQWCESDFQIPDSQPAGDLTIYWIWEWATAPNMDCNVQLGKDEYYTSCLDFAVEAGAGAQANVKLADNRPTPATQSGFQTTAVAWFKSRTAKTTSPPQLFLDNRGGAITKRDVSVDTAFAKECSTYISSIQAAAGSVPPSCPAEMWATGAEGSALTASVLAAMKASPTAELAVMTNTGPAPSNYPTGPSPTDASPTGKPTPTDEPALTGQPAPSEQPTGGAGNVISTKIYTTTITTVITEATAAKSTAPAEPPVQPSGKPPTGRPHGRPHAPPKGGSRGSGGIYGLHTVSTIGTGTGAPYPTGGTMGGSAAGSSGAAVAPTVASDGGVYERGVYEARLDAAHIAQHRRHARQFE